MISLDTKVFIMKIVADLILNIVKIDENNIYIKIDLVK